MSHCRECNADLGLWDKLIDFKGLELCPECRARKREKILEFYDKVQEMGEDNYLSRNEKELLNQYIVDNHLSAEDVKIAEKLLRSLLINSERAEINHFNRTFRELSSDGILTRNEINTLEKILNVFNLSVDKVETFNDYYDLKYLNSLEKSKLYSLDCDLIMKKGENCHYQCNCSLMEEKQQISYEGSSNGVSIRIATGLYWRIGATKGQRVVYSYQDITDTGVLYLTNKRVVFAGEKKNITYQIPKITDIRATSNSVTFIKENDSKYKQFIFQNPFTTEVIAKIMSLLLN